MSGAQGNEFLTFLTSAQPAKYRSREVVTDSYPNPRPLPGDVVEVTTTPVRSGKQIATGNGILLYAGIGPTTSTATSSDGITWAPAGALPSSLNWQGACFGAGVFIALGTASAIAASSPDGVTWTSRALPSSQTWIASEWGFDKFVAIAQGTTAAAYSLDGFTWSPCTMPVSSNWVSVAYGNGAWVAVSNTSTNQSAYSPDGITWTAKTLPGTTTWAGVAYGVDRFIAIPVSGGSTLYWSSDGQTWNTAAAAFPVSLSGAEWITFINGMFVIAASGINMILWSYDGIVWSCRSMTDLASISKPGYINGRLCMCNNTATGGRNTVVNPVNVRTITTVNELVAEAAPCPGTNVASVTVTGQTGLLATDCIDAWIQGTDSTPDHNAYEHKMASKIIKLSITSVTAGVGFTISGFSDYRLDGNFKVRWAWAR